MSPQVQVEILAYAPTEFFHCSHCEVVWEELGVGRRLHAEQQRSGQLPPDLLAEYGAISEWVADAVAAYGSERLTFNLVDAASIEGVFKSLRFRARRFPAFVIDGKERVIGFDRARLDSELEKRLGTPASSPATRERRQTADQIA